MSKNTLFFFLLISCCSFGQQPKSEAYNNRYKHISTYIPDVNDSIKYVNINFNIFQDFYGQQNFSPYTKSEDYERLINMFNWVNEIYARQPLCPGSYTFNSDPPQGVEVNDLPHKYIQFRLNGIYVYKDRTEEGSLWKSNNVRELLKRVAEEDSSRLNQINIFFTEKYYLGTVREINIINGGRGYAHPLIEIKGGGGHGARAYAQVHQGRINNIIVADGGHNYKSPPQVTIKGGDGKGAKLEAVINERSGKLTRINIIEGGSNYTHTHILFRGGGGSGAQAYIDDIRKGRIRKVSLTHRGAGYTDDPEVYISTDSKGVGASFSLNVRGATGFTTTPNFRDSDAYIVEKSRWRGGQKKGDYASATNIAHELGHVLDLLHTYQGGSETNNTKHHDYLWDVFGIPFSGYHVLNWGKDPCASSTDLVTNNLMGGNQISEYTSPMQIGKMHRALHIYNVKKYTDCICNLNSTWFVAQDEEWDFDIKLYNSLIVHNNSTLLIDGHLEMPDACNIIIEPGSELIIGTNGKITGGCNKKLWDGTLHVKKNAKISIMQGGTFFIEDLSKFIIE